MDPLVLPAGQPGRRQRRAGARARVHGHRAHAPLRRRAARLRHRRRHGRRRSTASRCPRGCPGSPGAGSRPGARRAAGAGAARPTWPSRAAIDVPALPRQRVDVHPRRLRGPRGSGPRGRGPPRSSGDAGDPERAIRAGRRPGTCPCSPGRGRWPCWKGPTPPRSSSPRTTSTCSTAPTGWCTTTRTAPASASSARSPAFARRDGGEAGPAPLEHPRHRLRGRHRRLHRRHADPPRPGRPQPAAASCARPPSCAADLWKLGQLAPGDTVRLVPVEPDVARELEPAPGAAGAHARRAPRATSRSAPDATGNGGVLGRSGPPAPAGRR